METALNGSIKRCISGAKNRNHRPNVRALTNETPELTMVLEKAQVLLNSDEYSALGMVLVDYLSGATAIEDFISDLSQIIAGGEKSSFFTEIREIVRPQDQGRFDRFVYQDNDPSLYQLFPSKDFDAEPSDNETMQDMADLMRSLPPAGTFDNGEEEEEDDENLPLLINQAYEGSNQAQLRPLPSAQENGIHRLHRRGTNKSIMDGHNDGDGMDLSCQQHFKPGLYNHAHPPQVVPFSFRSNGTGGGLDPFHFLNTSLGPSSSSSSSCPSSQNNHLQHLDHRHSMRRNSNMGPESEYMSGRNFHTSHSGSGRCLPFGLDEDEREALHPRQRPFSMSAMTDPEPGTTPPANSLFSRNESGETASARGELAHGPMAFRESTSPHKTLETALPALRDLGYDGVEVPLKVILYYGKEGFMELLKEHELQVIVMVFTDGLVAPGEGIVFGGPYPGFTRPCQPGETDKQCLVETHLKVFQEQVEAAQELEPTLVNSHSMIPVVPRDPYQTGDDRTYTVRIAKNWPTLGMAIEGGSNTQQPLARIIAIQPNGAAFDVSGLRVGQLIQEVDGIQLAGLPHEKAARIIAERFALKSHRELVLVVKDQKQTPAEKRHRFMPPQQ
eukprot:maker-scaffold556_size137522-snap-gene-0.36 protein:Tk02048 transcript:maker-scaffold556_size137522-snap-gene-0.36-mRNA-1 annotation:"GJ11820"